MRKAGMTLFAACAKLGAVKGIEANGASRNTRKQKRRTDEEDKRPSSAKISKEWMRRTEAEAEAEAEAGHA
jgi:hypothetical protein